MNQDWEQFIEQIFPSESPVWLEHRFSGGSLITYALVRPTLKNTRILVLRADFVNQPLDQLKSQIVQKSQTCWFFFFFFNFHVNFEKTAYFVSLWRITRFHYKSWKVSMVSKLFIKTSRADLVDSQL